MIHPRLGKRAWIAAAMLVAAVGVRQAHVSREARNDETGSRASADAAREAAGRRERAAGVGRLLALPAAPDPGGVPEDASGIRETLLRVAGSSRVRLEEHSFEPLARPPAGFAGTSVRIAARGALPDLVRFVESVESLRWPLRLESAGLDAAAGEPVLAARLTVFRADPEHPIPEEAVLRLAGDPRLDRLSAWLSSGGPPPAVVEEETVAATERAAPPAPVPDQAPPAPRTAPPTLIGFVTEDAGGPARAVLRHHGETVLAGEGDVAFGFVVREVAADGESALLEPPDGPAVRLRLR